jgi:hypothetical protein
MLCFGAGDRQRAEATTNAIYQEIKGRLHLEFPDAGVRVGYAVAELDRKALQTDDTRLLDSIAAELRRIGQEAEHAARAWRQHLLSHATISFGPVWDPHRQAVDLYRVLLDIETGQRALTRLKALSSTDDMNQVLFDLDCLMLGRATKALHEMHRVSDIAQLGRVLN